MNAFVIGREKLLFELVVLDVFVISNDKVTGRNNPTVKFCS